MDNGLFIGVQPTSGPNVNHMMISPQGSVLFPVGKVRIGGGWTDEAVAGLTVSGDLAVTGTGRASLFTATSDVRLKEDLQDLTPVLDRLRKISAKKFRWKNQPTVQAQIGLIAQQLEQDFPELVRTDAKGVKSVDYSGFSAVLLHAMQEQMHEIDDIKARLEKLER